MCCYGTEGRFVASVRLCDEHWSLWIAASGAVHRVDIRHNGTKATHNIANGCLLQPHCLRRNSVPVLFC